MPSLQDRLLSSPRRLGAILTPVITAAVAAAVVLAVTAQPQPPADAPLDHALGVTGPEGIRSVAYTQAVAAVKTKKPKVTVIGTGGTISGVATSRSSFTNYQSGRIA
ncbi:hypothetical protein FXF53_30200, partial [Micromonospora sp. WP24]